jgi:penicillin-binding protein 2
MRIVDRDREQDARFTRRALILAAGQAAAIGALGVRLYDLQVLNGAAQAALGEDNRTRTIWIPAMRGRILTTTGEVLADSRESFRAVLYPRRGFTAADAARIVAELAPLLRLSPAASDAIVARALGQRTPIVLSETLTFDDVAALQVTSSEALDVVIEPAWQRIYPPLAPAHSVAMAHIVGHVGAVDRVGVDDEPYLRRPGARIGKAGVEAGLEADLRGVAGRRVYEIDARSRHVRRLEDRAPIAGQDVTLTIDMALQTAAVDALVAAEDRGGIVVLDVTNGHVLALASSPSFDAADLRGPDAAAAWKRLKANPERPLLNRATAGQYPPASTFKIITALAALEAGQIAPAERIDCPGSVTYAGHTFRCWNRGGHGPSDLHKAMRESCDCYFYEAARRTGIERIAAMAREFGLGEPHDVGLTPQSAGLVPTPAWKRARSRTGWLLGETILAGIGQGYVLATPLQLAVMAARVATGRKVAPTIRQSPPGERPAQFEPLAVSESGLDVVRRALVAVVNEDGGTGRAAAVEAGGDRRRVVVAGKTGTSQVARASADRERAASLKRGLRDHAVFVAYAPADAPRFAIAVLLENAGSGGAEAGPVVKRMLEVATGLAAKPTRASGKGDRNGDGGDDDSDDAPPGRRR